MSVVAREVDHSVHCSIFKKGQKVNINGTVYLSQSFGQLRKILPLRRHQFPVLGTNLDAFQKRINSRYGIEGEVPIVYFTQLMSLAFGLQKDAMLERVVIDPRPVLRDKGLLQT